MLKRFFLFLCLYLTVVAVPAYATLPEHNLQTIKSRAIGGDALAQNRMGVMYAEAKNFEYASVWFRRAALQGNAYGQYSLATLYREGLGLPKDYKKAAEWYYRAALQGDAKAQYHLGTFYYNGAGVQRNVTEAINWFLKAAEAGEKRAYQYLLLISHRNQGVVNNMKADMTEAPVQQVSADLSNMTEQHVQDAAGDSLGLIFLQGAGASVSIEAVFLWVVIPLLCLIGFFAI